MARTPRPGLTSQPSEDQPARMLEAVAAAGPAAGQQAASSPTRMPVAVDAESGELVNSPVAGAGLEQEARDDDEADDERTALLGKPRKLPWYRRAHLGYIHVSMLFMALGMGILVAAKIEQFTQTICAQINTDTMLSHPDADREDLLPILLLTPEQCRHSTTVQKKVATLNLSINVIMGTLCIVTAPWWGALSDRIGRKWCISLNTMSMAMGDLVLLVVLSMPKRISYWWLLLYPFVEGVFAGMGGGQSIMAAYIGDCTGAGSRAGTFSIMMGTVFAGIAIGPAIGSLSIQMTGNPLTPFYGAFIVHCLQFIMNATIMPESLSKEKQLKAKKTYNDKREEKLNTAKAYARKADSEGYGAMRRVWIGIKNFLRPLTTVFEPLALLGPRKSERGGLDWSLPILAVTTGLYSMIMASYSVKMQYAQLKFGWTSVQLGNFVSLTGATRIVALCVAIPLLIKIIRKPHKEPQRDPHPGTSSARSSTQSHPEDGNGNRHSTTPEARHSKTGNALPNSSGFSKIEDDEWDAHKQQHRLIHDYKFDLRLARISILLDIISYTALCFTTTVSHFILFVMVQALGSGANPALSSLCLMFADPNETGSLMGALSVLQIIFAQVAGPILFNTVYASTVDTYPEAFFVVGAVVFSLTLMGLLFVRVRRPNWNGYSTDIVEEETVQSEILAT